MSDGVKGTVKRLSKDRVVFVGTHEHEPGTVFVGFRNASGADTLLKLSADAWFALEEIMREGVLNLGSEPYPEPREPTSKWVFVKKGNKTIMERR